jgi:hypothetical protein
MLDFVNPAGTARRRFSGRGQARFDNPPSQGLFRLIEKAARVIERPVRVLVFICCFVSLHL